MLDSDSRTGSDNVVEEERPTDRLRRVGEELIALANAIEVHQVCMHCTTALTGTIRRLEDALAHSTRVCQCGAEFTFPLRGYGSVRRVLGTPFSLCDENRRLYFCRCEGCTGLRWHCCCPCGRVLCQSCEDGSGHIRNCFGIRQVTFTPGQTELIYALRSWIHERHIVDTRASISLHLEEFISSPWNANQWPLSICQQGVELMLRARGD